MHPHARRQFVPSFLFITLVAMATLVPAAGAAAATAPRTALLENGGFSEFDQTNAAGGTLTNTTEAAYQGAHSAKASYTGAGENGYSRGIFNANYKDGDDLWYGAAYYLPPGFKASMQGQVDLLRWDNYTVDPNQTDRSGIAIYGSDKKARLVRAKLGVEQVPLVGPFDLPEGRWFYLEVHQRLGTKNAVSEVYLDGKKVGSSTQANTYGRPVTRVRYGLVAMAAGVQTKPLSLWFDKATMGSTSSSTVPVSAAQETSQSQVAEPAPVKAQKKHGRKKSKKSKHGHAKRHKH
ncbi:MAG: Polysaccharide lyase [Thermoleophilaceae bacterium]|nr:Polysaccharide lyase [Thermoleophilaceae bacterium]